MTHYPKFFLNKGRILTLWVMYTYNLKNSLKFKLLAFWRKWTPFIDQNCTYEKEPKEFRHGPPPPPPPHLDKIQKNSSFFSGRLPLLVLSGFRGRLQTLCITIMIYSKEEIFGQTISSAHLNYFHKYVMSLPTYKKSCIRFLLE